VGPPCVVSLKIHDTDRYGRKVAEVIDPATGVVHNRAMVKAGQAAVYRRYWETGDVGNRGRTTIKSPPAGRTGPRGRGSTNGHFDRAGAAVPTRKTGGAPAPRILQPALSIHHHRSKHMRRWSGAPVSALERRDAQSRSPASIYG